MTTASAIEARGLARRFGDLDAVAGVDLTVAPGEIYGFLGPNGAGKSTTVRMLCTLLRPTGGRASVAGHDVEAEARAVRLKIGVALQDVALDDKQSGREILTLQARLFGLTREQTAARLEALGRLIALGDALERRVGTYSGGMKRRLDLAAALVHDPTVLFLDEPTTGLDPISRSAVWDEVRRLNIELGMTIFLTTQYLEEADALADRVGIIDHGRIVAEGTPAELKRRIGSDVIVAEIEGDAATAQAAAAAVEGVDSVSAHGQQLVISTARGDRAIGAVAVALHDSGTAVRALTLRSPTLDDVFLELTGGHLQGDDAEQPAEEQR